MTDKEKIREKIKGIKAQYPSVLKTFHMELDYLLEYIDSLPEEPVSKDLEGIAMELEETIGTSPHSRLTVVEHLVKVANWKEQQMIDKACEWLSNLPLEDMTYKYNDFDSSENWNEFIEDFRKAMED